MVMGVRRFSGRREGGEQIADAGDEALAAPPPLGTSDFPSRI
jgi:hypothetical protein